MADIKRVIRASTAKAAGNPDKKDRQSRDPGIHLIFVAPYSTRLTTKIHCKEMPMPSKPETRIQELHLVLPNPPKPVAKYKTALLVGNMLYVSGHGPLKPDGKMIEGRVGADLTLDQGKEAARVVGLAILSTVRNTLGSLDKVKRLVKTLGMVNSAADFRDHPQIINGFSELMAQVFGDDTGVGTRSAVGMSSLPGNIAVEIECIFEVG